MSNFDPYHQWLGIPPAEQPPDHYRLLGIRLFEDDLSVIENAADRQMTHLKTFQAGPHSADSQRLLNEVAAARVCLLNQEKRGDYDQQLHEALSRDETPEHEISLDATPTRSRKSRSNNLLIAAVLGMASLVVFVLVALLLTAEKNEPAPPVDEQSVAVAEPVASDEPEQKIEPLDISILPPGAVYTDKPENDQTDSDTPDDTSEAPQSDSSNKPPVVRADLSKMAKDWGESDNKVDPTEDKADPESSSPQLPKPESPDDKSIGTAAPDPTMDPEPDQTLDPNKPEPVKSEPKPQPKQKLSVPSPTRQKEIVKRMEAAYDFSAAKTASAQRTLAQRLYSDGLASGDSEGESFVLLNRSAELSALGLDAGGMFKALDAIFDCYETDPLELNLKLLKRLMAAAKTSADILAIQQACKERIDGYLDAGRFQEALDTAKATYQAASRLRNKDLRKQLLSWQQVLTKLQKDHQEFVLAQQKLTDTPNNANAALTVGRWHCFDRDDYAKGLPFLVEGSDSALAAVAKSELQLTSKAQAPSPDDLVALGDAWWKLTEKAKGIDAVFFRLRSLYWYKLAQPHLSGLTKATIDKRLDSYAQLAYKPFSTKSLDGLLARGDAKNGSGRIKKRQPIKWIAYIGCTGSFDFHVNGKPVFSGTNSAVTHQHKFAMALGDIITVRVQNQGGPHGFSCLIRSEKGHVLLSGPAWRIYEPDNPDDWANPSQVGIITQPTSGNARTSNRIQKETGLKPQEIWGQGRTCYLMLEIK
ncbi:MAG: hypothetical protein JXM70_20615 [Pirellulales bacterium]|nr:hypothetical protein [Pirellulales bacterium]